MELLLQHTASAYTFEDTEHFRSSLLLFYQQVATEEHSSLKWALSSTLLKIDFVQHFYGNQYTLFIPFQGNQSDFSVKITKKKKQKTLQVEYLKNNTHLLLQKHGM